MGLSIAQVKQMASDGFDSAGDLIFSGVLTRTTSGSYNPTTGKPSVSTATFPCRILQDEFSFSEKNNTSIIPTTDTALLIEGLQTVPLATDQITYDGKTFNVVISGESSAGAGALWRLIVRNVGNV